MYLIILQEEGDFGSSWKLLGINVLANNKGGIGLRFPNILSNIIMLRGDDNLVRNQKSRVEANTQILDQI